MISQNSPAPTGSAEDKKDKPDVAEDKKDEPVDADGKDPKDGAGGEETATEEVEAAPGPDATTTDSYGDL